MFDYHICIIIIKKKIFLDIAVNFLLSCSHVSTLTQGGGYYWIPVSQLGSEIKKQSGKAFGGMLTEALQEDSRFIVKDRLVRLSPSACSTSTSSASAAASASASSVTNYNTYSLSAAMAGGSGSGTSFFPANVPDTIQLPQAPPKKCNPRLDKTIEILSSDKYIGKWIQVISLDAAVRQISGIKYGQGFLTSLQSDPRVVLELRDPFWYVKRNDSDPIHINDGNVTNDDGERDDGDGERDGDERDGDEGDDHENGSVEFYDVEEGPIPAFGDDEGDSKCNTTTTTTTAYFSRLLSWVKKAPLR